MILPKRTTFSPFRKPLVFCASILLFLSGLTLGPYLPGSLSPPLPLSHSSLSPSSLPSPVSPVPAAVSPLQLLSSSRRFSPGNMSCIIVGCHSADTPGAESYWRFYTTKTRYAVAFYGFHQVHYENRRTSDKWCDVPSTIKELNHNPSSRIIYVDVDTRIDSDVWCNLPDDPISGPLVVNSLTRGYAKPGENNGAFVVEGTRVQTNVFRVTSGKRGLEAMERWEQGFWNGPLSDQGAIHLKEEGLCGVAGWAMCYSNPEQQTCHCFGSGNLAGKIACIEKLFNGTHEKCRLGK